MGVPGSLKGKSFNNPLIRTNFPNTIVIFVLATAQHHTGNQASCMGTLYRYVQIMRRQQILSSTFLIF